MAEEKYISPKKVKKYKWGNKSAQIHTKEGKFVHTGKISSNWSSFSDKSQKSVIHARDERKHRGKVDKYQYFSHGNKKYKTDLFVD